MNYRRLLSWVVSGFLFFAFSTSVLSAEKLDRGLIALEREDGSVFLSWRLFDTDPENTTFQIKRRSPNQTISQSIALTKDKPHRLTNFIDKTITKDNIGKTYIYQLHTTASKRSAEVTITLTGRARSYISIPLTGDYDFQKVGIADLDGDGKAEVYCKAGEGDPRNEKGLVKTGPEYLLKLDGQTGKVVAKTNWLTRDGFSKYSRYCRNFLTVAYLDGKKPSLFMQRGTYNFMKSQALDKDFNRLWYWSLPHRDENVRRLGSHGLITADVDEDGRDEIVIGAAVLDDNGKTLWAFEIGDQPDICYVADIDPDNPGLENFYGLEDARQKDGMLLADARTGRKLWGHDKPTKHIHSQGMVADLLADSPGMETYGGESDYPKRWLYSSKGKLIDFLTEGPLSIRPLWWDADPQKEVISQKRNSDTGTIHNWGAKEAIQQFEGKVIAVVDCLGDHREELITALKGQLRIYSTTIPATDRRPCLMQNHQYRMGIVAQTMGYYYPAQLGK